MSAVVGSHLDAVACFGAVMHRRDAPVRNGFTYPTAFLRLPLSRLQALTVPWVGFDAPNLFSVLSRDHGARDGSDLFAWIGRLLADHGLAAAADGEVVLHTMPRMFGHVFNPVSFWFCHDAAGRLRVVLAEVSNTFGEHHNYLLHHDDLRPIERGEELRARKVFHVSPFFPVRGEYRFRFDDRDALHAVDIDYHDGDACQLATRVAGRPVPLAGNVMLRWLLRHPLMSLGVLGRIHWQALRLAAKRVTFFHKPAPPLEETTR